MTEQFEGSDLTAGERDGQLNAMQIQLRSQRASDILRSMTQVRKWLQENREDRQVYEILLDAVQENHDIREKVRDLFLEMVQKGSKGAEEAISLLPSTPKELLADADDAYYAAEYGRAIQLYLQVLKRVPDHKRAKEYLTKAKSAQQDAGDLILGLPREAVQYYRRARSYLAASDFLLAIKSLSAAVETAQARSLPYPDAEELLKTAQESLIADEYKQKANIAIEIEHWGEALDYIKKGLALNLADVAIKKELNSLQDLLRAELDLQKFGAFKVFAPLSQIRNAQRVAEKAVNPDNPLLNLISKELKQIRMIRIAGGAVLLVSVFFLIYKLESKEIHPLSLALTNTPAFVTAIETLPSVEQPSATITVTDSPTITPTETLTPAPTTIPVLGYGKIREYTFPLQKPNGDLVGVQLGPNQYLTILEREEISELIWYKCRWELKNNTGEGWLLEKYIQFAPPPTPTP
ncbi:MAG: hypothetical protein JNK26_05230 [Candidatus Doudnabacteria bacterium]|nr:hypothetical protein [Candidatus Doudnabacteria bacterium]